jgi:uncharacterized protein DUF932
MELYHANQQWAKRPADERFRTLADLYSATKRYADASREKDVPWTDLRVEASGDDMALVGKAGVPAVLTNYAFGQIAARVGAPASYLRALPATLAAQNLNHGLKEKVDGTASLLFHTNGALVLRAAVSEKYERIWNYEVVERLQGLAEDRGLIPARQTMTWDGSNVPSEPKDIALYASDRDMFAFLMSERTTLTGPTGETLRRGIIAVNSEVGDKRLTLMGFLFRDVCANHIIWGAEQVAQIDLTHVGDVRGRWAEATARVRRYFDGAASLDKAKFVELRAHVAGTKDEVLDALFGKRIATRKVLEASLAAIVESEDGDPLSKWGVAQGMTRYSQTIPYANERTEIDRAAGKVLAIDF